ncbi:MAG: hypothetical protein KDK66_02020 [Deltaproteobacteria bacterium]|nr:hypothetical protein [Deltaproteobacteria bacterium]
MSLIQKEQGYSRQQSPYFKKQKAQVPVASHQAPDSTHPTNFSQEPDRFTVVGRNLKNLEQVKTSSHPYQRYEANLKQQFAKSFYEFASDSDKFHQLLEKSYDSDYDLQKAEALRQRALAGDLTWLPKLQVLDESKLKGAWGAYHQSSGTIYLNKNLLKDPQAALRTYTEEVGHHLETQIKTQDSQGDEGEIFARLLSGDNLSKREIKKLKQEKDHGSIHLGVQDLHVEFMAGCTPDYQKKGNLRTDLAQIKISMEKTLEKIKVKKVRKEKIEKVKKGSEQIALFDPLIAQDLEKLIDLYEHDKKKLSDGFNQKSFFDKFLGKEFFNKKNKKLEDAFDKDLDKVVARLEKGENKKSAKDKSIEALSMDDYLDQLPKGLGDISAKYESGNQAHTVSSGLNDPGGVSYGKHQLSSKAGTMNKFLKSDYGKAFEDFLEGDPGSTEFSESYKKLIQSKYGEEFKKAQYMFLAKTHYEPALKKAKSLGFKVDSRIIQEAVFSGSIQHGKINKVLQLTKESHSDFENLSAEKQVKLFYKTREDYAIKNAPEVEKGLHNRYQNELKDVLDIEKSE